MKEMDFSRIVAVTNRHLCVDGEYLQQLRRIARAGVHAIIVREKDLPEEEYCRLFGEVLRACEGIPAKIIPHSYIRAAIQYHSERIQLTLQQLEQILSENAAEAQFVREAEVGVSVHSAAQAQRAEALGAAYVIAGHIFATDCKRGLAPRGLEFLQVVRENVGIDVYAIGGINAGNYQSALAAGADKVCMMSEMMHYTAERI